MKFFTPSGITRVVQQVFAATGTYTPTPGMVFCEVECQGGGGGSGGAQSSSAGTQNYSGPGGGGEYSRIVLTAAQIGASQAVTVGAAGAAGTAGNNNGGAGGASSVGTLCTANGGGGGLGITAAGSSGTAGAGGSGGTGSQKVGKTGTNGYTVASILFAFICPPGGDSFWGNGGAGHVFLSGATPGTGFGGGAGSATTFNNSGDVAGAAGSIGYVRITEYVR
jgi:hypothetical protein